MKHSMISAVIAFFICGCSAWFGISTDSIKGEWVGRMQIDGRLTYLRVGVDADETAPTLKVLAMYPPSSASEGRVAVDSRGITFELAEESGVIAFDGQVKGDSIRGVVTRSGTQGSFELRRKALIDSDVYDDYAGAYELAPDRTIIMFRRDRIREDAAASVARSNLFYVEESGLIHILVPSSQNTFFAGPTMIVPLPVEVEVAFQRDAKGEVNELIWREKGHASRTAPRSKRIREEEVRFESDGLTLAGRLVLPSGDGHHPGVAMIFGDHPSNRNSGGGVIARIFALNGIASLVYDRRGTGASEGNWREATWIDLEDDALAALKFLRSRKDINGEQVGLWGISSGGGVAGKVASRSKETAFLITVSSGLPGSTESGDKVQAEATLRADGLSQEEVREALTFLDLRREFIKSDKSWDEFQKVFLKVRERKWFYATYMPFDAAESKDHWYWRRERRQWEQQQQRAHHLSANTIDCPFLSIGGGLDVYAELENHQGKRLLAAEEIAEEMFKRAGNTDYTFKTFPNGGHSLWLRETTNLMTDLPAITTYVPGYFDTMINWILERVDEKR